ncbi:unnamed protein product [Amoebophrya sp. A120]|nr:unnamed protein product [Amoebophrya sp. A120]|eukprot:GSA120T00003353001.1
MTAVLQSHPVAAYAAARWESASSNSRAKREGGVSTSSSVSVACGASERHATHERRFAASHEAALSTSLKDGERRTIPRRDCSMHAEDSAESWPSQRRNRIRPASANFANSYQLLRHRAKSSEETQVRKRTSRPRFPAIMTPHCSQDLHCRKTTPDCDARKMWPWLRQCTALRRNHAKSERRNLFAFQQSDATPAVSKRLEDGAKFIWSRCRVPQVWRNTSKRNGVKKATRTPARDTNCISLTKFFSGYLTVVLLIFQHFLSFRVHGFGCFSDYSMSWCNNHTEASCIHDYTFSVSHFQRKLDAYYDEGKRPPLLEAYFMTKTPRIYQKEVFLDSDCAPPLIMAFLLVAEARLDFDPNAMAYFEFGLQQLDSVSADQKYLLENTDTWPLKKAISQITHKEQYILQLREQREGQLIVVDFVMCHCKEPDLTWINAKLRPALKDVTARLFVYEKCHQVTAVEPFQDLFQEIYIIATPDPSFVARGDECSAYLSHITYRYHELADFTVFIHSDPGDHLHFPFLSVVLKSIGYRTFNQDFMHLNGPRHVRTMTPCIQAIAERIFGHKLEGTVGPYCCAQFIVSRDKIHSRDREFYANMLTMVNGTLPYDLCTTSRVARSTHCYGMEFLWHVVWGENGDPPLRQDDTNLPTAFRLKYGVEHEKNEWNDVVLSPNVPKKIVTKQEWDGEKFVYLAGGPGSEERGDLDPRPEWTETYMIKDKEDKEGEEKENADEEGAGEEPEKHGRMEAAA